MARRSATGISKLLRRFDAGVQAAALAARTVVIDEIGPCYESALEIKKIVSILCSTTEKKMKDNICVVVVYKDHVNLMFPRGVDLKDPQGLLEGAGKAMRHIKIFTPEDLEGPGIRNLLRQARKRDGLDRPSKRLTRVVTEVKAKRRRSCRDYSDRAGLTRC